MGRHGIGWNTAARKAVGWKAKRRHAENAMSYRWRTKALFVFVLDRNHFTLDIVIPLKLRIIPLFIVSTNSSSILMLIHVIKRIHLLVLCLSIFITILVLKKLMYYV